MDILRFDAGPTRLPPARVSALPTFSLRSLQWTSSVRGPAATHPRHRLYAKSRYALTDAFRLCGAGPNGAVLAPAYHCRTMLDPALRLGAPVRLYPLQQDLGPDLRALEALLSSCQPRPVALLATHFFGIRQDLSLVRQLCQKHGVALVEDCSHCLWAQTGEETLGTAGRYSIWSPYKFFPCEDGGVLQANEGAQLPERPRRRPSWREEAKGLYRLLERSRKQLRAIDAGRLAAELAALSVDQLPLGSDVKEWQPDPSDQYDPAVEGHDALACSRWILGRTDAGRIRAQRRERYNRWASLAATLPHCRVPFPTLPDDCVPYMFPLHVEHPATRFMLLKRLGFPAWRWDNMASSPCPVAQDYRLRLLQLPCHQELTEAEFEWMLQALSAVMLSPQTSPQVLA